MVININSPPLGAVPIGRVGEHDFRAIEIDVSAWLAAWPEGRVSVIYRRPDGELYPVIVNATASPVMWRPTATDTAVAGIGQLEARIQIGDVLGKSCTIPVKALPALGTPGDVPAAPAPDWTQTVANDAARAEQARSDAQSAAEIAEKAVGNAQFAEFHITETGELIMTTSDNYEGPDFRINDAGELEMIFE